MKLKSFARDGNLSGMALRACLSIYFLLFATVGLTAWHTHVPLFGDCGHGEVCEVLPAGEQGLTHASGEPAHAGHCALCFLHASHKPLPVKAGWTWRPAGQLVSLVPIRPEAAFSPALPGSHPPRAPPLSPSA